MAKAIPQTVLDDALDTIATATEMRYCNGQPTSRADAITKQSAPPITLTSGDFSIADGGGGTTRVLTVAAKSATASVTQNTDHIALSNGSALLYVTTAPAQTTNAGSAVNSAAFTVTAGPLS